ncbi:MAG: polysaccharide deacetylase family protein [Clostridiales bacterium]|nr:polysaccharide deacetylase family protein [Clostridiales bacterium]
MVIKIKKLQIFLAVTVVLALSVIVGVSTNSIAVSGTGKDVTVLPILMYHQITRNKNCVNKFTVMESTLEEDLRYIKNHGYTAITVEDLTEFKDHGKKLPSKPIMISFDDGYETVYDILLPLLKKYDLKAVVAIIGSATDNFSQVEDHHLKYSHLNWEKVDMLVKSGYVEIQNHTYDMHRNSCGRKGVRRRRGENIEQYKAALKNDLMLLQDEIGEHTGYRPKAVVYPYGEYSKETPEILKELGFEAAMICEEKLNRLDIDNAEEWIFRLGRFNRSGELTTEEFFTELNIN